MPQTEKLWERETDREWKAQSRQVWVMGDHSGNSPKHESEHEKEKSLRQTSFYIRKSNLKEKK